MKGDLEAAAVSIAVLDDDADFRTYLEDFLTDEGYRARVFEHPDGLYAAMEEEAADIVLLDMKMGEFRGEEVLERLQAQRPGLCVIIVTGYPSLESMRATFQKKVFDYLSKPFTLAQLRQVLASAMAAHRLGRSAPERVRERLGQRIKMLRVERGWSLKDLAGASKLSISQASSIERGTNLPSIESLLAISGALGKKPSELLGSIGF